jgi:VanZ family protein
MTPRHTSAAVPLAAAWAALALYASLFPFTGWRWPPGHGLADLLALPWPPWRDDWDLWANLLGYLPWGWLLALAWQAGGLRPGGAWVAGVLTAAAASFTIEVLQNFLPGRHPSLKDVAMNAVGAGLGAASALSLQRAGLTRHWMRLRQRWFVPHSGGALALMTLWPFALLFPTPMPLGLGQIGPRFRDALAWATEGVSWAESLAAWSDTAAPMQATLSPLSEGVATALGLFAPCMLACSVSRPGPQRLLLALGAAGLALATMTVSALLNFGPRHALAWQTGTTLPAMAAATLAAMALAFVPRRVACGLALVALAFGVALVAQANPDPYLEVNLQAWEQGRWVRFHGVTQWVGLTWPYLAMLWLLVRLGRRDEGA